jgi:hypothetical protein
MHDDLFKNLKFLAKEKVANEVFLKDLKSLTERSFTDEDFLKERLKDLKFFNKKNVNKCIDDFNLNPSVNSTIKLYFEIERNLFDPVFKEAVEFLTESCFSRKNKK